MTLIFIKPRTDSLVTYLYRCAQKGLEGRDTWTDLQRLHFGTRVTETTDRADTCASTLTLCDANFAEVSIT
jgi:hypothetical protein